MTMPQAQAVVPDPPDGGGLAAGFQLIFGQILSTQQKIVKALDDAAAARAQLPVAIPQAAVGVVPNPAGSFVIDVGGPVRGRQWTIRRLAVASGVDVTTAIGGTPVANWYVGRPNGPGGTSGLVNQWVHQQALPATTPFSNEQVTIYPSDRLFVIVSGATTTGQQLTAVAFILDEPIASYSAVIDV